MGDDQPDRLVVPGRPAQFAPGLWNDQRDFLH